MGGTAKHEIVSLRGAFHGRLMGTLAATDRPSYRAPFRPLAGGIAIMERDLDELAVKLSAETVAAVIAVAVETATVAIVDPNQHPLEWAPGRV